MRDNPIDLLDEVAGWLGDAGIDVVYTGGTVVSLYLGELEAQEFRPTKDVDCVVKAMTYAEYIAVVARLRRAGFSESRDEGAPICRYERDGVEVDVMPVDPSVLGFSNLWYARGWPHRTLVRLPSGREVSVFPPEYLLASKIVAYESRGGGDPYVSHDFQDIVTLLDGAPGLLESIRGAETGLFEFVQKWLRSIVSRDDIGDILAGHVSRTAGPGRATSLRRRLDDILVG